MAAPANVAIAMIVTPAGRFMLGSSEASSDRRTARLYRASAPEFCVSDRRRDIILL